MLLYKENSYYNKRRAYLSIKKLVIFRGILWEKKILLLLKEIIYSEVIRKDLHYSLREYRLFI